MSTLTPSRFGSLDGEGSLHLPIPGLFVDLDAGSGSVALTDEFLDAPPSLRLEVIQQWLRALGTQRDAALVEMFREFAGPLKDATIVEQIDRFRQLCSCRGVVCPPDLALLLQRF